MKSNNRYHFQCQHFYVFHQRTIWQTNRETNRQPDRWMDRYMVKSTSKQVCKKKYDRKGKRYQDNQMNIPYQSVDRQQHPVPCFCFVHSTSSIDISPHRCMEFLQGIFGAHMHCLRILYDTNSFRLIYYTNPYWNILLRCEHCRFPEQYQPTWVEIWSERRYIFKRK